MARFVVCLVLVLAAAGVAACGAPAPSAEAPAPTPQAAATALPAASARPTLEVRVANGYAPPPFELPDVAGHTVSLDQFRGQVVLLDFWALWCEPCKAEMPDFQAALERYGGQGFAVITVDLGDSLDRVKTFIESQGYTFIAAVDTGLEVGQAYDARILPKSLLLDRQGVIRFVQETPFERGGLTAQIEALLAEEVQ